MESTSDMVRFIGTKAEKQTYSPLQKTESLSRGDKEEENRV